MKFNQNNLSIFSKLGIDEQTVMEHQFEKDDRGTSSFWCQRGFIINISIHSKLNEYFDI